MIQLKALGSLDLRGDDSRPLQAVLAQPKRLALLAYLAIATPRGFHRRDTIVGLLWPEFDETRARNALNKAVHHLRTSMGAEAVVSRGHEELGVESSLVWSDVAGFEEALERGDLPEALALYRGPLLPGFFVDENPEFDRWLETERARLQRRALDAARLLSEREDAAGRIVPAVEWARRATTLAPFDEPALRRLMTLLERAHDRAGALRAYEEFLKHLRDELDAEPDIQTRALNDEIRARDAEATARPAAALAVTPPSIAVPPAPSPAPAVPVGARPKLSRRALVAAAVLVTIPMAWMAWRAGGAAVVDSKRPTVFVEPFSVSGTPPFATLADSLASGLRAELNQTRELSASTSARARFRLRGSATANANVIRVEAALFDTLPGHRDPVARIAGEGAPSEVPRLTADLVAQMALLQAGERSLTAGDLPKPSPAVAEAMARGDSQFDAGRFSLAVQSYRRAVEIDSMFGVGYLALARAAIWENNGGTAVWAAAKAMRPGNGLGSLDVLRARTWDAYLGGRPIESERLARAILANDPYNMDTWYGLAETLFHWGPHVGRERTDAKHAFEQVARRRERSVAPLIHLARLSAMDGASREVDSLVALALRASPDATQTLELRGLRAFAGTGVGERGEILRQLERVDDATAEAVGTMLVVSAAEQPSSASIADALASTRKSGDSRGLAEVLGFHLALARGRPNDASARVAAARGISPSRVPALQAIAVLRPFAAAPAPRIREIRTALLGAATDSLSNSLRVMSGGLSMTSRLYLLGLASIRLGEPGVAAAYADSLEAPVVDAGYREQRVAAASVLRAQILHAAGKREPALDMVARALPWPGYQLPTALNHIVADARFLRAELLFELGRDAEALRWYGNFPDPSGNDLAYLAPALLRRAAIHARRGEPDASRRLAARADALWATADESVQAWRSRAKLQMR